jgi:FkbM family methyltransferase
MRRAVLQIVHKGYVRARRRLHRVLSAFPRADRVLGTPIRRLTFDLETRLAGAALPRIASVDGLRITYRQLDVRVVSRLAAGEYEPEVHRFIRGTVESGWTIVDCGAHIGWYTLICSRAVGPKGHVYAFEPVPETAQVLLQNVQINALSNVTVVRKAVQDRPGSVTLTLSTSSSAVASIFGDGTGETRTVEATSLDEYFGSLGMPRIDLVKIDVEGAERLVLEGMRHVAAANPRLRAIVEVNLRRFPLDALMDSIRSCGFSNARALELDLLVATPRDEERVYSASRRLTVNLLCER